MPGRLAGKVTLVTAAGQGIGRATAEYFAAEGAQVIATDINEKLLGSLDHMQVRRLDVTSPTEIAALAQEIDGIDVLFNCAGYVHDGSILDCDLDAWNFSFALNVTSMHHM